MSLQKNPHFKHLATNRGTNENEVNRSKGHEPSQITQNNTSPCTPSGSPSKKSSSDISITATLKPKPAFQTKSFAQRNRWRSQGSIQNSRNQTPNSLRVQPASSHAKNHHQPRVDPPSTSEHKKPVVEKSFKEKASTHLQENNGKQKSKPDTCVRHSINEEDVISSKSEIGSLNNSVDEACNVQKKERIRALQGTDPALEHFNLAGERMPPPCDWEGDRPQFDNSFMNSYINEWRQVNSCKPIPTGFEKNKRWQSGQSIVNDQKLLPPPKHLPSIPTPGLPSVLESKRVNQTAYSATICGNKKNDRKSTQHKESREDDQVISPKIVHVAPERSPFSPKIQMYMRPATIEDSKKIAEIYNGHIEKGNITEDQEEISLEDAMNLINRNKREKLPFIVAVAGQIPRSVLDADKIKNTKQNNATPKHENVIGFAFNERFNRGLSGSTKGRSRYTTTIQLFVAHKFQSQGVGRNLLDRLLHILSTAYGYRKTCEFANRSCDEVHESGGSGMWHQIQFHVPVLQRDDPDFPRIKSFLFSQFLIREVCRMKSVGRTNFKKGPAKWLDTVVFQFETSLEGNFDPYC